MKGHRCLLFIVALMAMMMGESLGAANAVAQVSDESAISADESGVLGMVATGPTVPANRTGSYRSARFPSKWVVTICPRRVRGVCSATPAAPVVTPAPTPSVAPSGATGDPLVVSAPAEMTPTEPSSPTTVIMEPWGSRLKAADKAAATAPATPVSATPVVVAATPATAQLEGVHEQLESLQSAVRILETTPRSVTVIEQERASWLRWGFGASGVSTGATDSAGPNAYLAEGYFRGELGFASGWFCTLQAGGGTGSLDGAGDGGSPVAISNFVGIVNYTLLGEDYPLALGGRQRVTFVREGNRLNAVMGELQFSANLFGPLSVTVIGGLGSSWYIYEAKPTFVVPGLKMENELKQGAGLTYELMLGLYLRLF